MNSNLFKAGDSELAISIHHDTAEIIFNNNGDIFTTRTPKEVLLRLTFWLLFLWIKSLFGFLPYLEDRKLKQQVLG